MIFVYSYTTSAFANSLFALFLVYYVYLRNRKNPLNRSFLYFGLTVGLWSLLLSFWSLSQNSIWAERLIRAHMLFATLIPATFFHFAVYLANAYDRHKRIVFIFYFIGIFYSVMVLTPAMIQGVKKVIYFDYWPQPGFLMPSHIIYFAIVIAYGIGLLAYQYFRTQLPVTDKRRTKWALMAFIIGFSGGSTNWFLWFDVRIFPLMNFFVAIMFALIAYAIVRHGLMDVDTFVEILRSNRLASLGLISASITHELRNPFYIAKGNLETLLETLRFESASKAITHDAVLETLEKIRFQLNRATDIMQRYSTFAKTPHQESSLVKINEVAGDVLKLVTAEIEIKRISIDQSQLTPAILRANRTEIEEILFNLVMNACQAMESEVSPLLTIKTGCAQDKIFVEISDTGPGIPDEIQGRIFEPFVSSSFGKGTGLGLYITRKLVEKNNGTIHLTSSKDKGTTFRIEFKTANT